MIIGFTLASFFVNLTDKAPRHVEASELGVTSDFEHGCVLP